MRLGEENPNLNHHRTPEKVASIYQCEFNEVFAWSSTPPSRETACCGPLPTSVNQHNPHKKKKSKEKGVFMISFSEKEVKKKNKER